MQNLSLRFYQRIILWQLVGNHPALRLTDAEMLATQVMQDSGRFSWRLPDPGYGNRELELEHEEAKALVTVMETPAPVRVSDAEWMLKVAEELKTGQPSALQL